MLGTPPPPAQGSFFQSFLGVSAAVHVGGRGGGPEQGASWVSETSVVMGLRAHFPGFWVPSEPL